MRPHAGEKLLRTYFGVISINAAYDVSLISSPLSTVLPIVEVPDIATTTKVSRENLINIARFPHHPLPPSAAVYSSKHMKGSKECYLLGQKHNMQIFGVIPLIILPSTGRENNDVAQTKNR